ncbi:MAG: PfkB family carbohydrate kinase [Candidatus Levybacteria bacterium]|nr:PfkB family carbohydrate kinase [Candidatus Levybacteria bacterium]
MRNKIKIASIGDLIVDIYPQLNKIFPGGTAFNAAYNAAKAGAETSILSAIGTDNNSNLFREVFKTCQINTERLITKKGNTSSIKIKLDNKGCPLFYGWNLGVLDKYKLCESDKNFLKKQDIVRAVLFKQISSIFKDFCSMKFSHTLKAADFADISEYAEGIEVIKKYIKNLDIIIKSLDRSDKDSLKFLKQIAQENKKKIVIALLGGKGSVVFSGDNVYSRKAIKTAVKDTNGAGDSYIANFLVTYLKTKNIQKSMMSATDAASKTITHLGAVNI